MGQLIGQLERCCFSFVYVFLVVVSVIAGICMKACSSYIDFMSSITSYFSLVASYVPSISAATKVPQLPIYEFE